LLSGTAFGAKWTIEDTYVGNDGPTQYIQDVTAPSGQVVEGDVVSDGATNIDLFNIDGMIVNINKDGDVKVKVVTDYMTNTIGTKYGDLFISVNPEGTFYNPDTVNWNYVFDTESKSIYATTEGDLKYSDDFGFNSGEYRTDEIVQFDPTAPENQKLKFKRKHKTNGFTNLDGWGDTALIYSGFNLSDLGIEDDLGYELAFGWAMTCANDMSIVGNITIKPDPVPEPSTMLLLGMGILGISVIGRKAGTQSKLIYPEY
jgi:hypothetical protein